MEVPVSVGRIVSPRIALATLSATALEAKRREEAMEDRKGPVGRRLR